jgi:uncharacterized membrane protein YqjE
MAGADPTAGDARAGGLLGSVKSLAATLVAVASTRLQLIANELHEERLRIQQLWLLSIIAVFFFAFGVLLFTLLAIAVFWDSNRLLAIGGFAALYSVIGIVLAFAVRNRAADHTRLFAASLSEFKKDRDRLSE